MFHLACSTHVDYQCDLMSILLYELHSLLSLILCNIKFVTNTGLPLLLFLFAQHYIIFIQ